MRDRQTKKTLKWSNHLKLDDNLKCLQRMMSYRPKISRKVALSNCVVSFLLTFLLLMFNPNI